MNDFDIKDILNKIDTNQEKTLDKIFKIELNINTISNKFDFFKKEYDIEVKHLKKEIKETENKVKRYSLIVFLMGLISGLSTNVNTFLGWLFSVFKHK